VLPYHTFYQPQANLCLLMKDQGLTRGELKIFNSNFSLKMILCKNKYNRRDLTGQTISFSPIFFFPVLVATGLEPFHLGS